LANSFSYHITKFFAEYLPLHAGLSKNTLKSYRDAFVLFLNFVESEVRVPPNKISLEMLDASLVEKFLLYLEEVRKVGVSTRNQRLSAIHSFARYLQKKELSAFTRCSAILAIPFKKGRPAEMAYFSIAEITALLAIPNVKTKKGLRDLAMLTALYETGARVQELVDLTVSSLNIEASTPYVELRGKGNKLRKVPISDDAADILRKHMKVSDIYGSQTLLFTNPQKNKLTRAGVQYVIDKYIAQAKQNNAEFFRQVITNHSFRHSKAMHLLEAGVNLVYIRDFLGHSSVTTTEVYAKTNPEVKRKALIENSLSGIASIRYDSQGRNDLLEWLKNNL